VRRETLIDLFRDLDAHRGDFLVYDDGYRVRRHTYRDVTRATRGFARRLADNGIGKGDKVVLWGENRPEWIACYWGCVIAGVVVVPIDYRSSPQFLTKVATIVSARAVLVGDDVPEQPRLLDALIWRFRDLDWQSDGPLP
jgi:long-chain acyl-CoA synthetase